MSLFFLINCATGLYAWLEAKRLIMYFLFQGDMVIILLYLIWRRQAR